ncbi:MAG: L-rhamnose isomerase [Clostridiales bacterium]|nr:L-rhamnose isomerase [Clostridiales bacterium]
MDIVKRYQEAKELYKQIGVDTEHAIKKLSEVSISMHCWQGDDVTGFEGARGLSGGIQATGSYPGKARTPKELMDDMDMALSLIPGTHRINLHASYGVFEEGNSADRDKIIPEHFKPWVEYARERNLGIDFNPTFFSHPLADSGLTLSHPDERIRRFWINHGKACLKISEYIGKELNKPCLMNIWVPDGYKDIPADRYSPRKRLMDSLDEILSTDYKKEYVRISVESKVFGIGLESYTVGSHEFYMNYASTRGVLCLLDSGHYHPTETISDKIPSLLLFSDKLALHVTRAVRWDSDHVVLFDDELREIAKEIIRNNALDKVLIGLDYFDASINRISAWVVGMRNMMRAMLYALLLPNERLAQYQSEGNFTEQMILQEELKSYPFGDVWDFFCEKMGVPVREKWYMKVKEYEDKVLVKRV